jgi:hypothetical protein
VLQHYIFDQYVPIESNSSASLNAVEELVTAPTNDQSTEQPTNAYPFVQPMKASLFFDSADGFGEWRIFISQDAIKWLRQTRNADKKLFRIVIKKIR